MGRIEIPQRSAAVLCYPLRRKHGSMAVKRRDFITLLGGTAAAWPLAARAQQPAYHPRRIGILMSAADDPEGQARVTAFREGLQKLGWTEGRNVWIDYRWTGGDADRIRAYAMELVSSAPDVILANGSPVVAALRQETSAIPIVFAAVVDPVISTHRIRINTLALAARLPTMHSVRAYVEAGGLMSYGPNYTDLFRRAGELVDKILRGAKPADIPVEQPTKFDLVINLTTAKALGLDVPPTLLARADEVIE
jgi:ABC-type uncharacterized transport system substrate-binding protein